MQKYDAKLVQTTLNKKKPLAATRRWGLPALILLLGSGLALAGPFAEPFAASAALKSDGLDSLRRVAPGQLRAADSLFARGQYEAAVPLYRAQVWRRQWASGQLLLRLAFAQHQLGHYPAEVLYLNLAQARQPRLNTWRQLVALAQRQRLVGYPASWQQELRVQAQRYFYPGLQGLLGGAVVLGIGLLLRPGRRRRGAWLGYGAYLLGTGAYLTLLRPGPVGIVTSDGPALMTGPSAGTTWLSTAALGDRLPILGRHDIWLRVSWQEREAYVRSTDVLVIE